MSVSGLLIDSDLRLLCGTKVVDNSAAGTPATETLRRGDKRLIGLQCQAASKGTRRTFESVLFTGTVRGLPANWLSVGSTMHNPKRCLLPKSDFCSRHLAIKHVSGFDSPVYRRSSIRQRCNASKIQETVNTSPLVETFRAFETGDVGGVTPPQTFEKSNWVSRGSPYLARRRAET